MEHFEKAYFKALRFLSYRQRSEKEVRDNLLSSKFKVKSSKLDPVDEKVVDQVIEKLKEQRFINDEVFARMWIESRMRAKPRSLRVIKMELRQKGISDDITEKILEGEDTKILSEKEMALKLIEKKLSRYKNLSEEELKIKLGQLLASKGFNWDTIKEVVTKVLRETS